ncbi:MAG: hypothetical protein HY314_01625 [Acidobacteria bacterium]|nr:hypothetical protein [Acidobacteriota bacterium]
MIDCDRTAEVMPWLLNGTLEAVEQQKELAGRLAKLEAENQRLRQVETDLRQQQDEAGRVR